MAGNITFVLCDQISPEKRKENRRTVASHIGRHYRNRSAPLKKSVAKELECPTSRSATYGRRLLPIIRPKSDVLQASNAPNNTSVTIDDVEKSPSLGEAKSEQPDSGPADERRTLYSIYPYLQPWIQFSYPESHRRTAELGFDLEVTYVLPRHSDWGPGPNPYTNCLVQMMCRDRQLFDAIAASAHGVYTCSTHHSTAPTPAVLVHRARALCGMQEKLLSETAAISNETMLAVFYLLENAARFRHFRDFRAHYNGLRRMMQLRGKITPNSLEELYVNQAIVILETSEIAWRTRMSIEKPQRIKLTYNIPKSDSCLLEMVSSLPLGFQDLVKQGSISFEVLSLLADVPPADYIKHDLAASQRQLEVVRRARLLLRATELNVERLVCLGTIAFSLRIVIRRHFFQEPSFWRRLAAAGKAVSNGQDKRLQQELKVWATVVAADLASSTCKDLAMKAVVGINNQHTWAHSWQPVSHSMQKFFYANSFAPAWQVCWESAVGEQKSKQHSTPEMRS